MTKEQRRSVPNAARDAEFLGWQKAPRGNVVPLYNVTTEGHISLDRRFPKTPCKNSTCGFPKVHVMEYTQVGRVDPNGGGKVGILIRLLCKENDTMRTFQRST